MTAPVASPASTADPKPRRGGPPIWFALFGIGGLVLAVLLLVAQALGIGGQLPGVGATVPPAGAAAQQTHDLVKAALEAASFQVQDPQTQFHPGETPALIGTSRILLQVVLPSDPTGGYVVIYDLGGPNEADAAGREFATYLASGVGAIQYPADSQFVIRRMGSTLVFFAWSSSVSPDPSVARLASVLAALGNPLTGTP